MTPPDPHTRMSLEVGALALPPFYPQRPVNSAAASGADFLGFQDCKCPICPGLTQRRRNSSSCILRSFLTGWGAENHTPHTPHTHNALG